jgi:hypothetical protein
MMEILTKMIMIVSKAASDAVTDDIKSLLILLVDKMASGAAGTCLATETAFQSSLVFSVCHCCFGKFGTYASKMVSI